jgi:hypothetical protein
MYSIRYKFGKEYKRLTSPLATLPIFLLILLSLFDPDTLNIQFSDTLLPYSSPNVKDVV